MMFQSAPRSRDRGDLKSKPWRMPLICFNPRPGHATGATCDCECDRRLWRCFNPRPGHATGATIFIKMNQDGMVVSIRAPVTRPGRHIMEYDADGDQMFQSAPRSRDRGDARRFGWQAKSKSFNPRPGHATGAT